MAQSSRFRGLVALQLERALDALGIKAAGQSDQIKSSLICWTLSGSVRGCLLIECALVWL